MKKMQSISIVYALIYVAIFLLLQIIAVTIVMAIAGIDPQQFIQSKNFNIISIGLTQCILFALVIFLKQKHGFSLSVKFEIKALEWKLCVIIIFLALSFQVIGSEIENYTAHFFGKDTAYYAVINTIGALPGTVGAIIAFFLIVFTPAIVEELFFRRILQQGLSERYSITVSIVLTSVLFSAIHMNINYFIPIFILSVVLGIIYARLQNILYCILLHMVNNLLVLVLIRYNVFIMNDSASFEKIEHYDWRFLGISLIIFFVSGFLFIKQTRRKSKMFIS